MADRYLVTSGRPDTIAKDPPCFANTRSPNRRIQRYRDYARQRQMTLGDLLLENRIVFLEGVINDAVANMTVMKFLFLQYENRTQGISFYINSPGGSVTSTLAIYDTMQFIESPIATYCIGLAASGGGGLARGRDQGQRFALPHSKIMIHQPYGQVGGQVSDIEIQAEEIVKSKQVINEILAKHTGQPIERVAKDTERDRYLTAIQAKEYGLVDEVVGRIPGQERHAVPDPEDARHVRSCPTRRPDQHRELTRPRRSIRARPNVFESHEHRPPVPVKSPAAAHGSFSRRAYQSCLWSRS